MWNKSHLRKEQLLQQMYDLSLRLQTACAAQAAELARVKEELDIWKATVERHADENDDLHQQVAQVQGQLWEALAALGYPVPGETPPPRYHCGFCAATQAGIPQKEGLRPPPTFE